MLDRVAGSDQREGPETSEIRDLLAEWILNETRFETACQQKRVVGKRLEI
jgi:hypothetical protein